jgi:glyoxylase-like metal-dependent hydrolase (beta-lactamase superfamily II)
MESLKRLIAVFVLVMAGLLPLGLGTVASMQAPPRDRVRVQLLSTGAALYMLTGGGGNSLVLVRDEGVVLIDSKLPGMSQAVVDAVARVTDRPITTIINTHAHIDHTGGNVELPPVTDIIAHERARVAMQKMEAFTGRNAKFLPNKTVAEKMSLFDGRDRIDLYYFGRGHTDGDLVVVLPGHAIAYLGDLFPVKAAAPVIDRANGGSGVAFPDTLDRVLREIKGVNRVVAGHDPGPPPGAPRSAFGEIPSWEDLQRYAEFNRDFLGAVRTAIAQGKSAAEAAATSSLPSKYTGYDLQHANANVEVIYTELSGTNRPAR